jgi:histidinol-phosphate aminotransferase
MLLFLRSDLAQFTAYTAHTQDDLVDISPVDRLDTNESYLDLPQDLKQKLAWTYQELIEANRYPDGGHSALKQAIAAYVNESAATTRFDATHISVGNGSDELIRSLLIATCLGNEGSILVAEPTFSMYGILARTLGIPVVAVPRSPLNFEMDLDAAQGAIVQTQAPLIRVVFVVHPNSPTGNGLTDREIDWLRSLPPQVLVVIDEAYFEFSQTTLAQEILQRSNWVILRTCSKAFRLAAHRVGYAIAQPDLINILEKVRLPYNLPTFSQAAALTALTHRQALLQAIPDTLQQRDLSFQVLRDRPELQVWQSAANFIYVRLQPLSPTPGQTLAAICQALKAQGTLIRHTGGGLRITIGSPAENQRTLERLQVMLDGLNH